MRALHLLGLVTAALALPSISSSTQDSNTDIVEARSPWFTVPEDPNAPPPTWVNHPRTVVMEWPEKDYEFNAYGFKIGVTNIGRSRFSVTWFYDRPDIEEYTVMMNPKDIEAPHVPMGPSAKWGSQVIGRFGDDLSFVFLYPDGS